MNAFGEEEDDPYDPFGDGGAAGLPPVNWNAVQNLGVAAAPVDPGGGGAGAGAGLGSGGSARPVFDFPGAPVFKYPKFDAPSKEMAEQEPGYQFRLNAGQQALERSASAKGILRTGGTLKDFVEYGQNFGAAEYNNVFNRALQGYDREYRGAYDAFAPKLAEYNNLFRAELASGMGAYDRDWQQYVFNNTPRGGGGGGGLSEMEEWLSQQPTSPTGGGSGASSYGSQEDDDWRDYQFAA